MSEASSPPAYASATAVAAMLANALFDATGVRLFRLPLSPERVKDALRAKPTA